jgi:hypothetical protein
MVQHNGPTQWSNTTFSMLIENVAATFSMIENVAVTFSINIENVAEQSPATR